MVALSIPQLKKTDASKLRALHQSNALVDIAWGQAHHLISINAEDAMTTTQPQALSVLAASATLPQSAQYPYALSSIALREGGTELAAVKSLITKDLDHGKLLQFQLALVSEC